MSSKSTLKKLSCIESALCELKDKAISELYCYTALTIVPINETFDDGGAGNNEIDFATGGNTAFVFAGDNSGIAFYEAIQNCVDSNGSVDVTFEDENGSTHDFTVDSVVNNGSSWQFSGTNNSNTGANSALLTGGSVTCVQNEESDSKAYAIQDGKTGLLVWKDYETGEELNPSRIETLTRCPVEISNDCITVVDKNSVLSKRCFERPAGLRNEGPDTGQAATSNDIVIIPNEDITIEQIIIFVDNQTINDVELPISVNGETLEVSGLAFGFPDGDPINTIPAGRYPVIYVPSSAIQLSAGETLTISSVNGSVASVLWTGDNQDMGGQLSFSANNSLTPQIALLNGLVEKFCETDFADGRTETRDELSNLIDSVPNNAEQVPCNDDGELTERAIFVGKECYAIPSFDAQPQGINSTAGTLQDGTSFTVTNISSEQTSFSANSDGDLRTENGSIIELVFSRAVTLLVKPTTDTTAPINNPLVWSHNSNSLPPNYVFGGVFTFVSSNGSPLTYDAGSVDAEIDIIDDSTINTANPQNFNVGLGQSAFAGLPQIAGITASDDWGVVTAENGTVFRIGGRDAEAFNVSVIESTFSQENKRTAYALADSQGEIIYRDSLTNEVVEINEQNKLDCCNKENPVTSEIGGSMTVVNSDFTFPQNVKSLSIAPNDANSNYDFVGGNYSTLGSRISMSIGQGNSEVITNSGAATLTARGTIQVAWEV